MTNISSSAGSALPVVQVAGRRAVDTAVSKDQTPSRLSAAVAKPGHTSPAPDELKKLVQEMQDKVAAFTPELQFSIDQDTGQAIVKVTDQTTKEVVWQFPSETAFQIAREIDRFQKGLLLNRKA